MLARRIDPPRRLSGTPHARGDAASPRGRWRQGARLPTRGPGGEVRWWERSAPRGDLPLWDAVQAVQRRRLQLGVPVNELARRLAAAEHPLARETLSRVLNGRQPTVWDTVEAMAEALGLPLHELHQPVELSAGGW